METTSPHGNESQKAYQGQHGRRTSDPRKPVNPGCHIRITEVEEKKRQFFIHPPPPGKFPNLLRQTTQNERIQPDTQHQHRQRQSPKVKRIEPKQHKPEKPWIFPLNSGCQRMLGSSPKLRRPGPKPAFHPQSVHAVKIMEEKYFGIFAP